MNPRGVHTEFILLIKMAAPTKNSDASQQIQQYTAAQARDLLLDMLDNDDGDDDASSADEFDSSRFVFMLKTTCK